ncbi:MAG: hypothetical protein QF464_17880, partial [Myxococcota bacterium]|nr:hypothetical protein [Myxococcota bacterium]
IGFISQMSPFVGAALETVGVNPISGRAALYPEIMYNPERGRIQAVAPSLLETLPSAIIPQIRGTYALAELAGVWQPIRDLRDLRMRDPDAFHGRIFTSFGVPFAPRRRSRVAELSRAAIARDDTATQTVNRALRTGDWSHALRYDRAYIRGRYYNVDSLYELAQNDPEMLEAVLNATSR